MPTTGVTPEARLFLETMKRRRSIRRFTPDPVSDEQMLYLLEAAMCAPTGGNTQSWRFVVIRDAEIRRRLTEVNPYSEMCVEAPVVIAVCGEENQNWRRTSSFPYWIDDACVAAENILLAATALGLGAVWVGMKDMPNWTPEDMAKVYPVNDIHGLEKHMKEVLGLPETVRTLCLIALGWPLEEKPPRTQYDPTKVHYERWYKSG
jgi:nitroreductase